MRKALCKQAVFQSLGPSFDAPVLIILDASGVNILDDVFELPVTSGAVGVLRAASLPLVIRWADHTIL